jgi:hypothetical protein
VVLVKLGWFVYFIWLCIVCLVFVHFWGVLDGGSVSGRFSHWAVGWVVGWLVHAISPAFVVE